MISTDKWSIKVNISFFKFFFFFDVLPFLYFSLSFHLNYPSRTVIMITLHDLASIDHLGLFVLLLDIRTLSFVAWGVYCTVLAAY